jgi:ATP-binding cassette, subfamily B (MDR/TAP), member 1
MMSVLQSG